MRLKHNYTTTLSHAGTAIESTQKSQSIKDGSWFQILIHLFTLITFIRGGSLRYPPLQVDGYQC